MILNGINSIRLGINTASYDHAASRKRIPQLTELKSSTEADKKKQFKTELSNEFDSRKNQPNTPSVVLLPDSKLYRSNLLSEIYNKMSGMENSTNLGHYVEYYA